MKMFFDESGNFSVTDPKPHIMVGVLYPECKEAQFYHFYSKFVSTLFPAEFIHGEPKGSMLQDESRNRLFDFISKNKWIRISISLTDSEFNNEHVIKRFKEEQTRTYTNIRNALQEMDNSEVHLRNRVISEFPKLNEVLVVKGFLLMLSTYELLVDSFAAFESQEFDKCWDKFLPTFDRQDQKSITRLEKWVNLDFMHFISDYSARQSIVFPESWKFRKHPLISNFKDRAGNRLILNKMFPKRFHFEHSFQSKGLQIVDWISNTMYRVLQHRLERYFLDEIKDNLASSLKTGVNVAKFKGADSMGLWMKYQEFFLRKPKTTPARITKVLEGLKALVLQTQSKSGNSGPL